MKRTVLIMVAALGVLLPTLLFAATPLLQIVAPWEISSKDPSKAGYVFTRLEVGETLVNFDPDGQPLPALAESWSSSEDRRVWRFNLRSGVHFHNNTLMTPQAVLNSLKIALKKPGVLSEMAVESIEADGNAIVFRLSRPFSPILAFLAHYSTIILAPESYNGEADVADVIGTGPYKIALLQIPQKMEIEAFKEYWGAKPSIDRALFLAVGRGETRALLAESGEAQVVFNLDPATLIRLGKMEHIDVISIPIPRVVTIKMNCNNPALNDPRARLALSMAIDRAGIAKAILRQPDFLTDQFFPPCMGQWHNKSRAMLKTDVKEAERLLAQCGWKKMKSGMVERDGRPFKVELLTYPDRPELPLIAAAVQDQFRSIGVDAVISINNSSEVPARHKDNTLEMALVARNFSLVPDPLGTMIQDFDPKGGDWGAMNWSNVNLTKAISDLVSSGDPSAMSDSKQQIITTLHQEMPVIPVVWYQQTAAVSRSLKNVVIDPYERTYRISAMEWREE